MCVSFLTPQTRVALFALILAGIGASLLSMTPDRMVTPSRAWSLPFVALLVLFALAEAAALHIEVRKEALSISLSSIPMVIGLLFTSPIHFILAYLIGSSLTMIIIRRSDPIKTIWNICLFFAQAALASLILRSLLGMKMPESFTELFIVLVAVLSAELTSLIMVALVIMVFDGQFRSSLLPSVASYQMLTTVGGTFALTVAIASNSNPSILFFGIFPLFALGALVRLYGRLGQRYSDLEQIHRLTNALNDTRRHGTIDTGLTELVDIMRSEHAGLLTIDSSVESGTTLRSISNGMIMSIVPDPVVEVLFDSLSDGPVTHLTAQDHRHATRALLEHLGANELLAARVLGEVERSAVIYITDRIGTARKFNTDEIGLFRSLANTLSTHLSNNHLVDQLEAQALHDSLTGLPNRLTFEHELTARLENDDADGVVVMLDLDRFKDINDSLGHDVGDQLLIEVAKRLRGSSRSADMVARFGGDEFAIFLARDQADGTADFDQRLHHLHGLLTTQFQLQGISFEIGASLGAVRWPEHGNDAGVLLRRADVAMYVAKRKQSGVAWYSPDLDDDAPRRLNLSMAVRSALEAEELDVFLQPKVSAIDGSLTGAEALARWTHPTYGPIGPDEFVPLITQGGLIGDLTRFVMQRSVDLASRLRADGLDLPIAVNLTARDLLDPTLPGAIGEMLERADVPGEVLMVEITEDAMIVDIETSITVLNEIRRLGVSVAIDDFGTGYSSLQHLHRLPVDQLKIDQSFISRMAADHNAETIVKASISLARDLGLTTVGEGVENERSLRHLAALGCTEVQGYLVGRPMGAGDFAKWIVDWEEDPLRRQMAKQHLSAVG